MLKHFYILCFIVLFVYGGAYPEIRYTAELYKMPMGSRISAMGEAGVALGGDAMSSLWNPALIASCIDYQFISEYARLYGGMSSVAGFALCAPVQDGLVISGVYIPFFSGAIERYDSLQGTYQDRLTHYDMRADGDHYSTFSNNQNVVVLSVAKSFTVPLPRASVSYPLPVTFGVGFNFKGYWSTMDPDGKVRMGVNANCDIGVELGIGLDYNLVQKQTSRQVFLAAAVRDILPTSVSWIYSPDNYSEPVTNARYYGLSYVDETGLLFADWTISCMLVRRIMEDGSGKAVFFNGRYGTTWHAGIEAKFWKMLSARLGISHRNFTCGVGLQYKVFTIDYAFHAEDVDNSPVRITVGFHF